MARDPAQRKSVIPRLAFSNLKRLHELKHAHSGETAQEKAPHPQDDSNSAIPEATPATTPDTNMDPIFLGEDFSALLKLPLISSQENLWIDLWQSPDEAGDKPNPLDEQYLSSLKSFVGLRCLRVTGMLKSYQKQLFQAIWKMEQLEDLQLRMAEEPRLASGVHWRRIEEGWLPRMQEVHAYISPGNGKGRIKKQYGNAEYLDNCVIELAKPKLSQKHPEYETWMARLLPLVHLTLRGFVVDAIPFCSCFDAQKLRSITFADCYDAGFYLPHEVDMDKFEIRVDELKTARTESIRRLCSDEELKHITLKDGKMVEEHHVNESSTSSSFSNKGKQQGTDMAPAASSRHIGRTSRHPWHFRSHVFNAVIEDDEGED
ncbi:hypothetical protein UA08_01215 [Talaromyces atroroseus]|uniref:Uncharacterized protein n=1 Tax=Talaromyces atroroseus TaxID=1441469 RepID=A0A1Q5QAT7_TALAT|nr:hypothetical protein UA08_01215 [Talaromyces atroroseus]OKL63045.1 hypothetical protein UA08_01215 [Talaromyces atroroseus]